MLTQSSCHTQLNNKNDGKTHEGAFPTQIGGLLSARARTQLGTKSKSCVVYSCKVPYRSVGTGRFVDEVELLVGCLGTSAGL